MQDFSDWNLARRRSLLALVGTLLVLIVISGALAVILARGVFRNEGADARTSAIVNAAAIADADLTRDTLLMRLGLLPSFDVLRQDGDALRARVLHLRNTRRVREEKLLALQHEADRKLAILDRLGSILLRRDEEPDGASLPSRQPHTRLQPDGHGGLERPGSWDPGRSFGETQDENATYSAIPGRAKRFSADLSAPQEAASNFAEPTHNSGAILHVLEDLIYQERRLAMESSLEDIRRDIHADRTSDRVSIAILLLCLYGLAAFVSILLMRATTQIFRRARTIHMTARFEQVTSEISNLFTTRVPHDIERHFEHMLAVVGRGYTVGCASFASLEASCPVWHWQRNGLEHSEDWIAAICEEVPAIEAVPEAAFRVPGDRFRPSPALAARLERAGVSNWACAKVRRDDEVIGLLCLDYSGSRIRGAEGLESALAMLADVVGNALTRQELYKRHRTIEAKLRRTERLETIGLFASGIAHNFNNVLGVIEGQVELATDALDGGGPARSHVQTIGEAGRRAQEMVREILAFGSPEGNAARPVAVGTVLAQALAQVRSRGAEGARVTLRGGDLEGLTLSRETQLQQVFVNLIQNALHATDGRGPVVIELESVASGPLALTHGQLLPGFYTRVLVTDHGAGMSQATLGKLFQPFFSTKPAGTGLGLATALETVRQTGGGINVWSAIGRGSRFEVWLPQMRAADQGDDEEAIRTVLLVNPDRDELLRDEDLLATLRYEPVGFADVVSALRALQATPDRFDAVIVEHAPSDRWTGLQILRSVHDTLSSHVPLVMSTATLHVDAAALASLGVVDLIRRPWQAAALHAALRQPSHGRRARTRQDRTPPVTGPTRLLRP